MSEWREFAGREQLDTALAQHLARALQRDLAARSAASMALSGGSTPRGMCRALANCALDWDKVLLTLVDERWVNADHPDSNERLLRENLLCGEASRSHLVGLKTAHADALDALEEVRQKLARLPMPFTAVVLGMGGDGHTASWFPRAENLRDLLFPGEGQLVGATDPITAPHQRITLTLPAVLHSREIIIHITGEQKRDVLQAAAAEGHPIAAVTMQHATPVTIWWAP